eukprot:SAG31_NODE_15102_length_771_cov_0.845238_1_plen_201_part_10
MDLAALIEFENGEPVANQCETAKRRHAAICAMLDWKETMDMHFIIGPCDDCASPSFRFRIAANGSCRAVAACVVPKGAVLMASTSLDLGAELAPPASGDLRKAARNAREKMVRLGLGSSWLFADDIAGADTQLVERSLAGYFALMAGIACSWSSAEAANAQRYHLASYFRSWPSPAAVAATHPLYWSPGIAENELAATQAG